MAKHLLFGAAGRARLLDGVDCLADLVQVTFGPLGRTVLLDGRAGAPPIVARSGRDIASHVELADPFANVGVRAMREAAMAVHTAVGDGTTTTIVLSRCMMHAAIVALRAGASAPELRRQMIDATVAVVGELGRQAVSATEATTQLRVASSAAGGDDEIGSRVVAALEAAGALRSVLLEAGYGATDEIEHSIGHVFSRGLASTGFRALNDAPSILLERPLVFVCEEALTRIADVEPALSAALAEQRSLLVVATSITGDALRTLSCNNGRVSSPRQGGPPLACAAIVPALSDDVGRAFLEDVAVLTGAHLVPTAATQRGLEDLGGADRIRVEAERTTLESPHGEVRAITAHIRGLLHGIDVGSTSRSPTGRSHERERALERLRGMDGRGARVRVGARSEMELRARLSAYEASLAALASALEEGVLPGGGVALARAKRTLGLEHADSAGARVIAASLDEPLRLLAASAGVAFAEVVDRLEAGDGRAWGVDVPARRCRDMVKAGIFDPVAVVRLALQTATGLSTTLMDAAVTIVGTRNEASDFDVRTASATREDAWRSQRRAP